MLSRVAGRLAGVPVVSHIHIENHFRPNRLARSVHAALDNGTARLAARVVAVSASTTRSLVAQGYPPRLVEVVHNGIDVEAAAGEARTGCARSSAYPRALRSSASSRGSATSRASAS